MIESTIAEADPGMGWLEFISSVVGSVAWPIAACLIALMFRRQLAALLDKVRKLSWGDTSVDFTERLREAETVALELAVAPASDEPAAEVPSESGPTDIGQLGKEIGADAQAIERAERKVEAATREFDRIMENSPFPKIVDYLPPAKQISFHWDAVERRLRSVGRPSGDPWPQYISIDLVINLLGIQKKLRRELIVTLQEMFALSQAARVGDVTSSDARRFERLARTVIGEIDHLA